MRSYLRTPSKHSYFVSEVRSQRFKKNEVLSTEYFESISNIRLLDRGYVRLLLLSTFREWSVVTQRFKYRSSTAQDSLSITSETMDTMMLLAFRCSQRIIRSLGLAERERNILAALSLSLCVKVGYYSSRAAVLQQYYTTEQHASGNSRHSNVSYTSISLTFNFVRTSTDFQMWLIFSEGVEV